MNIFLAHSVLADIYLSWSTLSYLKHSILKACGAVILGFDEFLTQNLSDFGVWILVSHVLWVWPSHPIGMLLSKPKC